MKRQAFNSLLAVAMVIVALLANYLMFEGQKFATISTTTPGDRVER